MDCVKPEFDRNRLGFSYPNVANFTKSQWGCLQYLFVTYRVSLAVFQTCFWMMVMIGNALQTKFIVDAVSVPQLTAFGYTFLTMFSIVTAALAVEELLRPTSELPLAGVESAADPASEDNADNEQNPPNPKNKLFYRHKFAWWTFVMAAPMAPLITIGFFVFLFPKRKTDFNFLRDIVIHGTNSMVVFVELAVNAIPVRVCHMLHPFIFGHVYILFTLFYWWTNEKTHIIYEDILDWNHPVKPIVMCLVGVYVALPLAYLLVFSCYKLRIFVFNRFSKRSNDARQKSHRDYMKLETTDEEQ
ncbi:protein rolling stone-like [Tubulanus polymorphus]|uniref:protein rolling stone-like n=1 Tax=Tubulanus polymorphus TaxID=672921 RepID=UPI003DA52D42